MGVFMLNIKKMLDKYLAYKKITCLSIDYFNYEKKELKDFECFCQIKEITNTNDITKDVIIEFVEFLKNNKLICNSNKTINKKVASLKRAFAYNEVQCEALDKFSRLKQSEKHFDFLSEDKVERLNKYIKRLRTSDPTECNEKAILCILLDTGVRVSELLDIRIKFVDIKNRSIHLIHTKTHRERFVFIQEYTRKVLKKLLEFRNKDDIFLFWNYNINKPFVYRHLRIVIEHAEKSTGLGLYSHMLRHTFATEMADSSMNLYDLKNILGHRSIKTTEIYLHGSVKKMKKAYDKCVQKSALKK